MTASINDDDIVGMTVMTRETEMTSVLLLLLFNYHESNDIDIIQYWHDISNLIMIFKLLMITLTNDGSIIIEVVLILIVLVLTQYWYWLLINNSILLLVSIQ